MKFKLSEISKISNGKKAVFYDDGTVPVYGANGPIGTTQNSKYNVGDIVIGRVGANAGAVHRPISNFWASDNTMVVTPGERVRSEYLTWLLQKTNFNQMTSGSAQPLLNQDILNSIDFEIPGLSEQDYVISVIEPFENQMGVVTSINDNLLELASTLFEGSFPNVRGGENAIGTLMSNFDKQRKPLSKNQRAQRQGEYRYIGATSVVDHVDDFTFDGIYLLLGEDGTVQTDEGKPVLQYVWGPFWPNNHTHVLQGKGVSTEWLYLFWKNQNITSIITGAVQPKISQGNMNSIKMTKPSDVELATFQQKIDPIFNMIRLNADEIENLKVIRDQLLKELLG